MRAFRTGDLLIHVTTIVGQFALGRLYFTRWKQQLSPRAGGLALAALVFAWTCCSVDVLVQDVPLPLVRWIPHWFRALTYEAGTTWALTTALSLILYYTARLFLDAAPKTFSPARRAVLQSAAVLPFAGIAFGAIVERTDFHVKEIDLPVPGLDPDLEGFQIVQISDLHVSPFLSLRQAARVIDMANETRAHLAVMTGDLITEIGDPLDETIRELGRLRADYGVLGCLGNHEHFTLSERHTKEEAAKYGVRFLRQETCRIRRGNAVLNVAGIDYQSVQNTRVYLAGAEKLIAPGASNLLLSHNPDVFPTAVRKGFDAVLAGHTHGGQVTIEILNQTANFARFVTPFVSGLYRIDGRSCYVTPGIGTIGMPVRLGARPEVSLLRLRRA
ncbi:MAG TPA: metallophosphoesterase [Bryobacteraceae bacterium]|nr:metallophosphoesterase [Bryobacteraceae bacterium]